MAQQSQGGGESAPVLKFIQAPTLYLAGSGTVVGSTAIVLQSLEDIYGNPITSMDSFGDKGYITIEPDTSNEEAATFDGLTVNANGTVTLTGVKNALAQYPYTETSGLVYQHFGGGKVVLTDNAAFWNRFTSRDNEETLDANWSVPEPSEDAHIATKGYADNLAIQGSPNASESVKGISKLSVAPASGTNPIAAGTNDPRIPSQDENDALAGTSGTPSSSNKFVTNNDTSASSGAGKVYRQNGNGKIDATMLEGDLPAISGKNLTGLLTQVAFSATQVAMSGTENETTIATFTVKGGMLGTGNFIKISIPVSAFSKSSHSGATLNLNLKYGATTLCTAQVANGSYDNNRLDDIEVLLFANGTTGSQRGMVKTLAGYTAGSSTDFTAIIATGTATEDSTADKTLTVTAQFQSSGTTKTLTTEGYLAVLAK